MDILEYLLDLRIPKDQAESYVSSLIQEGYDDIKSLKEDVSYEDLKAVGMRPGHIKRVLRELSSLLSVSVSVWTVKDCSDWIQKLESEDGYFLTRCAEIFRTLEIDGQQLMTMTDNQFSNYMGTEISSTDAAKQLFSQISELQKEQKRIGTSSDSFYFRKDSFHNLHSADKSASCVESECRKDGKHVNIKKSLVDSFKSGRTLGIMLPPPLKVPITHSHDLPSMNINIEQSTTGGSDMLFMQENLTISPFGFDFHPVIMKDTDASSRPIAKHCREGINSGGTVSERKIYCTRESVIRIRKIGSGGSGTVFKAIYEPTFELLAIKHIEIGETTGRKEILAELRALYSVSKYSLLETAATLNAANSNPLQCDHFAGTGDCSSTADHNPYDSETDTPLTNTVTMRRCASGYISDSGDECVVTQPVRFVSKLTVAKHTSHVKANERNNAKPSTLSSQHIVKFYDAYIDPQQSGAAYLVLEYLRGGSLQDILDKSTTLKTEELAVVAYSVVDALCVLHAKNIVHRDIKPANILVNSDGVVKLSDFGIMRDLSESMCSETFTGTLPFMSPERIRADKYTSKSDIWSLGVSLLTLHRGLLPFPSERGYWVLREAIQNFTTPSLTATADDATDFIDFVQRCLIVEHEDRPSARDLLQHPFIHNLAASHIGDDTSPPRLTSNTFCSPSSSAEIDDIVDHIIQWQLSHVSMNGSDCYIAPIPKVKFVRLAQQMFVEPSVLIFKHDYKRGVFNDAIQLSRELNKKSSERSSSRRSSKSITAPVMAALLTVSRTLAPTRSMHDLGTLFQQQFHHRGDVDVDEEGNDDDDDDDDDDGKYKDEKKRTVDVLLSSDDDDDCEKGFFTPLPLRDTKSAAVNNPLVVEIAGMDMTTSTKVSKRNYNRDDDIKCILVDTAVLPASQSRHHWDDDVFDFPRVDSPSSFETNSDCDCDCDSCGGETAVATASSADDEYAYAASTRDMGRTVHL